MDLEEGNYPVFGVGNSDRG